jgi:hypothetical protein
MPIVVGQNAKAVGVAAARRASAVVENRAMMM